MRVTIRHEIRISLPPGTSRAVMHVLLTPRNGPTQSVREWQVQLPEAARPISFADGFGNTATLVAEGKPQGDWIVLASGTVDTEDRNGVLGRIAGEPVARLFLRQTDLTQPIAELVTPFEDQARGRDRIGLLHALMGTTPKVMRSKGQRGATQSQSQAAGGLEQVQVQTLTPPATSSRPTPPDLVHAFIGAARALGIPARYVTGYLARETATAPAMHAWAEAYGDSLGWIGFDPMLQHCPTDRHVRVAVGLDATSGAPLRSSPVSPAAPVSKLSLEWTAPQPKK